MGAPIHGFSNAVAEYRQGRGASVAFARVRRSTSTEVRKDLLKRSRPELFVSENFDKAFRRSALPEGCARRITAVPFPTDEIMDRCPVIGLT